MEASLPRLNVLTFLEVGSIFQNLFGRLLDTMEFGLLFEDN